MVALPNDPLIMAGPLDLYLVRAYLSALFTLARHGNTFANEAGEMVRELSEPDCIAAEFFGSIDRDPHTPFEKLLRLTARQSLK